MRSRTLACLFAAVVGFGGLLGSTGCQPLYGGKPDKLAKPPTKKRPPEPPPVVVEIKYIEDCVASFRDDPKKAPPPQRTIANKLADDGDAAMAAATKMKEPIQAANAIKDAVDKYGNALKKDPYNAEITLKLAVAYDAVYRKGCALAMLKRLQTLSTNPSVAPNADRVINGVSDNSNMFKGYRKEAVAAIGR